MSTPLPDTKKPKKPTPMKRKPNKVVVEALEEMLELAKKGEVVGIILAANKGSSSSYRVAGRYQCDTLVFDLMSLVIDQAGALMKNQWDLSGLDKT